MNPWAEAGRYTCIVREDDGTETSVEVRPGQHLLAALRARGLAVVPVGCRGGGCGVCRIQVLEGDWTPLPMSRNHVSEEAERDGFALACRVVPRGPLVVLRAPRSPG